MNILKFEEWQDDRDLLRLTIMAAGVLLLILGLISYQFGATEGFRAGLYTSILFAVLIGATLDFIMENNPLVNFQGFGDRKRMLMALAAGAVIGFIVVRKTFSSLAPVPQAVVDIPADLTFLYIVIVAPFAEELGARGLIMATLIGWFKNGNIALVGQALIFALAHGLASNWAWDTMSMSFVFAIICAAGNQIFKTLGFGLGLHFVNNYFAWTAIGG